MKLLKNDLMEQVGFINLLREDFDAHHRDWTRPGFRALAVYRFGVWARSRPFVPARMIFSLLHILLFRYIRNSYGIELYYTSKIGRRFVVGHQNGIIVHEFATIGDDCCVRQGVTMGLGGIGRDGSVEATGPVIGDRVDIGAGAMIIGKVRIGNDVSIGPNAVIMNDLPSNVTVLAAFSKVLPRMSKPEPQPEARPEVRPEAIITPLPDRRPAVAVGAAAISALAFFSDFAGLIVHTIG